MLFHITFKRKLFVAYWTGMIFFFRMSHLMILQVTRCWKLFVTNRTAEGFLLWVCPQMLLPCSWITEFLVTLRAEEWFLICVYSLMYFQMAWLCELCLTMSALKGSFIGVKSCVFLQVTKIFEFLVTNGTAESTFIFRTWVHIFITNGSKSYWVKINKDTKVIKWIKSSEIVNATSLKVFENNTYLVILSWHVPAVLRSFLTLGTEPEKPSLSFVVNQIWKWSYDR